VKWRGIELILPSAWAVSAQEENNTKLLNI